MTKKTTHRVVSSELYLSLKQDLLDVYKNKPANLFIPACAKVFEGDLEEVPTALSQVRITYGQAIKLLGRARDLALETPEGFKYSMTREFVAERPSKEIRWSERMVGEVRIFSSDLMCYYTGKSWKKLE